MLLIPHGYQIIHALADVLAVDDVACEGAHDVERLDEAHILAQVGTQHAVQLNGGPEGAQPIQLDGDALAVKEAGAQMILLEAIPPEVGKYITENLEMPVLSIGAGPHCDGQLLIVSDAIGQFQAFTPKFVKKYCHVAEMVTSAMQDYAAEVRAGEFPKAEHCYNMIAGEEEKFYKLVKE